METETPYSLLDDEGITRRRLPYPKSVFFIIFNVFFERCTYFGIKTILYVYLTDKLHLDATTATVDIAVFTAIIYAMCMFGGIIADCWLGKFKTILILSIVYVFGSAMVSIGSLPYCNHGFIGNLFYIGLFLISVGSGGIKPSVSAFGGDQFHLPEQSDYLNRFFSVYFLAMHFGISVSTVLSPILKERVHCFGENDCYPFGFGMSTIFMILSVVILVIGRPWYTIVAPSGNILIDVTKCTWNAVIVKFREGGQVARQHFLDHSIEKYGQQLVNETKCLLNILVLFLPLPIFWTLYDQQSSIWTEQAKHMNLNIGFYKLQPEQMQILNPILTLVFIPLLDYCVYPLLSKIGVRKPLQKMGIGGVLAAFAFLLSAIVQWEIELQPTNTVSVMWQIPQIVTITLAGLMFSIIGVSFSFEQAPKSMKSVVHAFFLSTVAFGDLLLAIISDFRLFKDQTYNLVFYEALMLVDMLVFVILAKRYKPIDL